jgi:hypothetical protein
VLLQNQQRAVIEVHTPVRDYDNTIVFHCDDMNPGKPAYTEARRFCLQTATLPEAFLIAPPHEVMLGY